MVRWKLPECPGPVGPLVADRSMMAMGSISVMFSTGQINLHSCNCLKACLVSNQTKNLLDSHIVAVHTIPLDLTASGNS